MILYALKVPNVKFVYNIAGKLKAMYKIYGLEKCHMESRSCAMRNHETARSNETAITTIEESSKKENGTE